MSFENIPLEMRQRVQWVTFDIEGNKKIPYVAGNFFAENDCQSESGGARFVALGVLSDTTKGTKKSCQIKASRGTPNS